MISSSDVLINEENINKMQSIATNGRLCLPSRRLQKFKRVSVD